MADGSTDPPRPYDFPETAIVTVTECDFLQHHTPKAVIQMVKDGSYGSKLAAFLNVGDPPSQENIVALRELFGKYLTLSDVGQRKGLVVPKKDAEDYFPDVRTHDEETMLLRFVDRRTMRWLDFRYCFYRSSQSYVLTTGWCKFVKANGLKEKDLIKFYECVAKRGDGVCEERYIMIDIVGCGGDDRKEVRVSRVREEAVVVSAAKRRFAVRGGEKGEESDVERGVRLFGVRIG